MPPLPSAFEVATEGDLGSGAFYLDGALKTYLGTLMQLLLCGDGFPVVPTIASTSPELVEGGATLLRGACAGMFAVVTGALPVVLKGGGALTVVV